MEKIESHDLCVIIAMILTTILGGIIIATGEDGGIIASVIGFFGCCLGYLFGNRRQKP